MAAKPYNGHPSWAAWNVSLWICNEEWLYRLARSCIFQGRTIECATQLLADELAARGMDATPDGARYSKRSLRRVISALKED
jgi:hypothetical protein